MKFKQLTLLFIFSIIFISVMINCGKSKNPVQSTTGLTIDQFPMQIGAQWEYYIIDSLIDCATITDCIDSATVTILDSVPNNSLFVNQDWLFEFHGEQQVIRQMERNENINLIWNNNFTRFPLRFPMDVGDSWLTSGSDSVFVIDQRTVTTPYGIYENAYYLERRRSEYEEFCTFHIWIVPNVGIVKVDYSTFTIGFEEKQSWYLKSYNPDNPIVPFTVDKFPNHDGLSWTYQINDAAFMKVDTVIVQVAESATVAIWSYDFGDSLNSVLVSVEGDTVKFITQGRTNYVRNSLLFPLTPGDGWITYPLQNESFVRAISNHWTPEETYFPTYEVNTFFECGDECSHVETIRYVPNIGIVQKYIYRTGVDDQKNFIILQNELWQLIDYNFRE